MRKTCKQIFKNHVTHMSILNHYSPVLLSSFKWRVTVSGELMFLESYGNCDVTNTVTLLL